MFGLNPPFSIDAARHALDRLRRLAECTQESTPHPFGVAETGVARNHIDTVPPRFEHQTRRLDAQTLDGFRRRLPRFLAERTRELTRTQMRGIGKPVDG